jgi:hypothetical protein
MKSVMKHLFSQIPRAEISRSVFDRSHGWKSTFDSGYLVPFLVDEVLPGDSYKVKFNFLARLSTPVVPTMDNLFLDTFYFFVPYRLFTKMGKHRPVKIKARATAKHTRNTLLIREICTNIKQANNDTMLNKRFCKSVFRGSRRHKTISGKVALRCFCTSRTSRRILDHRIDNNRAFRAAEIFRTLEARLTVSAVQPITLLDVIGWSDTVKRVHSLNPLNNL